MPHEVNRFEGHVARTHAVLAPPFGPGFKPDEAERAELMVVTGSSFSDPGGDWCEFELFDADNNSVGKKRVGGY